MLMPKKVKYRKQQRGRMAGKAWRGSSISFSRTAEEKSDWVFLSLQNENGAAIDSTPEARIAALPCLDSRK